MNPVQFSIPLEHPCLPGHFPRQPVVPGVVILDAVQSVRTVIDIGACFGALRVRLLLGRMPGTQARHMRTALMRLRSMLAYQSSSVSSSSDFGEPLPALLIKMSTRPK